MPQAGKRSTGYRTFITCDDPRGVVECGTIRKQKIITPQKGVHEKKSESHRRKQKNLNHLVGEEAQSTTPYPPFEVSRGAQKLKNTVSSWSCGHSTNSEKGIAKDVLIGALDLEESLTLLSKLQNSSDHITGSAKKQLKKGGFDDNLRDEVQEMRSHECRLSGSSTDAFEEIKRVVQNGVDGKNVFSDLPSSEEEACDDTRLDSSDVPSTSSSQSSIVHSSNFVSPESLLSTTAAQKKSSKKLRGSNLAKLIGLEDAFLSSLPSNGRKHLGDAEKIVNQKKPTFDLDSPRASKHGHDHWKSGWKRRTLDQMVEALKFKGNSKSSLLNGAKSSGNSYQSEFSNSKQRCGSSGNRDNWLPIVIMKPSRFSCLNVENPIIPKPRAEVDEETHLKMRIRTNPLAETNEFENLNGNEKEMVDKAKGKTSSPGKPRTHKKHSAEKYAEEGQTASGRRRKGERKKIPKSESHFQSSCGDKFTILEPKSSRGANNTRIEMVQNATTNSERQETMSSSNSTKNWPEDGEEITMEAVVLLENGDQRSDNECERESLLLLEDSTRLDEHASQIEITDYVDDDQSSSNETALSSSNTQTSLIFPNEHGTTDGGQESQCSTTSPNIDKQELHVCLASCPSIDYSSSRKGPTGENKLKELLLSSSLFISRVKELFDLKANPDKVFTQENVYDIDQSDLNARMLLDSANELVELHGHECSRVCSLLPLTHKTSFVTCYYTSLDRLLDEVCAGIEALGCCVKDEAESHSSDNLILLVKEDIRNRRMVSGVWDIGWRNEGSADEIEEISRGLDQLVLDGLIEEILVDLTL